MYQLGSVTKQFTAAVILQLQEQKKIVGARTNWVNTFRNIPGADTVTIENLLDRIHPASSTIPMMVSSWRRRLLKPATPEKDHRPCLKTGRWNFRPGTKWNYSNSGYMLLGYIIEKVTGQPYEQVSAGTHISSHWA